MTLIYITIENLQVTQCANKFKELTFKSSVEVFRRILL